ncbi:MAG TPA: hypothetical protein VMC10_19370 [Stellaceae bacterium]|nr:hypothetical protein [Stellaceae bacterium]
MDDAAQSLARALIAVHGAGALKAAKEALANAQALKLRDSVSDWNRVIAAINAMRQSS